MGSFILSRDDRGLITTRCVWRREPRTEWLERRIELWQRRHVCWPPSVHTPIATVSGPCGNAGPETDYSPTPTENGAQSAARPTTKEKP